MLTEIGVTLSSLNTASGIAKGVIGASAALDQAELKYQLADLMQNLATATANMADLKLMALKQDEVIADLREKLKNKDTLVRAYGVYYRDDGNGNPTGSSICSKCWDVDRIVVHIVKPTPMINYICPNCKTPYSGNVMKLEITPGE